MDYTSIILDDKKTTESTNGLVKHIQGPWPENLTVLDLSNKQLTDLDNCVVMPPNLINLNLSHNNLQCVPAAVLNLAKIECLNLSHNTIQYFDDTPNFCQSIIELDLSHNKLAGPPYWIWTETPMNLDKLNLSCNMNLTHALDSYYLAELLIYKPSIRELIIFNCQIKKNEVFELLGSFNKLKTLEFGTPDLYNLWSNNTTYFPCKDLEFKWNLEIERLNLSNTQLCSIENNIDIYKNLLEINLSQNKLSGLPNSFCCLENLEVCILSENHIMYLPEDVAKLRNLISLRVDSNKLCMLPDDLSSLTKLKILDLYNNSLYETQFEKLTVEEIDLAQNYLEEPDNNMYLEKKRKLRVNIPKRNDGRKHEITPPESEHSLEFPDDEELLNCTENTEENIKEIEERMSSPEDWDSEEYWEGGYYPRPKPLQSQWLNWVKCKMQEGNFCPMDMHVESVAEKVAYEKKINPKVWPVVKGQFDDLSSDES